MINKFKKSILLSALCLLAASAAHADEDWNYHGSGRDHPYSAYINRANYTGPGDYYSPVPPDYIDGPLIITRLPAPGITGPIIFNTPTQADEFTVNIPNAHGGINAVVIKKSGEGFVGPNGEYYPEFPKVFQLQMKYGN